MTAVIYLGYSRGFSLHKKRPIDDLIVRANEALGKNDYESAKKAYSDIRNEFAKLSDGEKKKVKPVLIQIGDKTNVCFIRGKLSEASNLVLAGKKEEAAEVYKSILSVYPSISQEFKNEVFAGCEKLHKAISGTA